jgi:isopentenyl-diphosphate delta-isomerase
MNRKDEHVSLAKAFHKPHSNDFDAVQVVHRSFPEIDVAAVNLETSLFNRSFSTPFFINAMTGGSEKSKKINHDLAEVAKACDLMMATGSVSAALKDPSLADTFQIVRQVNPEGFLLANVGAGSSVENALRAIDLFEADALQVHLNAPQELVMPEGDRVFSNWLTLLEQIVKVSPVPVIVKEVGFGMTRETIRQLLAIGVQTIDISGSGGTSFTQIENARRKKREMAYLDDFGQSTVISLLEANEVQQGFTTIASGGVRNAYDIFKALCLGANSVGISATILTLLLDKGIEETIATIESWKEQLRLLYTMAGQTHTQELTRVPLIFSGNVKNWCEARQIPLSDYSFR